MKYKIVTENGVTSRGDRRHFKSQLAAGFTAEQVEKVLLARASGGQKFLPGTFVDGVFEGEPAPLYCGSLSNEQVLAILEEQFNGKAALSFPTNGKITVGMKEGYGDTGVLHTIESISHLIPEGATVRTGTVCYAWPGGDSWSAGSGNEAQAIIEVEGLDEEQINLLAATLGAATGQTRVYVCLGTETWILQAEETETPTGETGE